MILVYVMSIFTFALVVIIVVVIIIVSIISGIASSIVVIHILSGIKVQFFFYTFQIVFLAYDDYVVCCFICTYHYVFPVKL